VLRFPAMGSQAHVLVVGGRRDAAERIRDRIDELEARWSRFLDTSEVSAINRGAGHPVRVSSDTTLLVRRAVEGIGLSGGSFDPTVLGAVERSGYDRTFADIGRSPHRASALQLGGTAIRLDGDHVQLPLGSGFDPGGIGKGLAADIAVSEALAAGAAGVCVNLGGDVRVAGEPPDGDGWTIGVHHPRQGEPIALVGIADGAVATSTTLLRTWHLDGERSHHIIDPATSRPSDTDLTLAAVISAEGWMAEILAKSVLLRGARHPFDLIGGTGAEAIAVDVDGGIHRTPGFGRFTGDATRRDRLDQPEGATT
jgi:thiamine biosynthesis lipoprotein